MAEEQKQEQSQEAELSVGKGALITLGALVLLAILIIGTVAVGGAIWVVCLGLTVWTSFGSSLKLYEVTRIWFACVVGYSVAYLIQNAEHLGTAALVVALVFIALLVFFLVIKRLTFIINPYCALFLTTGTATGIILEPRQMIISILFGYVTLGLLPVGIATLVARKKKTKASAEGPGSEQAQ
jgi:hypothetical protein